MNNIVLVPRNFKKTISVFRLMVTLILVIISASFSQAQVTPSVIISSNATNNSLCRGTAVTFTATPTNGGATPTYQWRKNGVNSGTGATLTLNNIVNNDLIRVVMTTSLSAAEVTSTTATSNAVRTTVNNLPSVVSTTPANITSCSSTGSATLNAAPSTGSVIDWYASTTATTPLLSSSNSYTTPNISATTTYYAVARDTVTGCQSNGSTAQSMAINWGPNNAYIQTTKPVTGSFTIEFWLNTTGLSGAGCSSWRCGEGIVSANTGGSNNDFGITMYNNYVAFGLGNPDVSIVSTTLINGSGWKHIAATWDSTTGAMKLYVNGVLEGSATGGTASRNGQTAMRLGALLNAPGNGAYGFSRGSLDEVRIWSKVKTQAEILANMNNNVNGREANLAEYFNFNQGIYQGDNSSVTTLYDLSLNGYNGNLNGFQGLVRGVQGNYVGGYGLNAAQYPVTATKIDIPTVASSTSGAIVCGGSSTTVSATPSAGAKIDWYADASGGTALATGIGTYTTPSLSSTTTFYAEARDTVTGCVSASRTAVAATVNGTPTAGITNNTGSTILTCTTTSISVTATGGTSYSWSNSLGTSANASITAAGTYTVTVTGSNGCTATSSITTTQNITTPTASITNNTGSTVLTCATTAISVTATGGATYSWSNSLGSSANASIIAAGTYTVTVTGSNGCTATSSITVTRDITTPTAGITNNTGSTILNCTTTAISVTATGGVSYSWNNSLGSSANASITAPGINTVTVTGTNGCTSTSSITTTQDITAPTAGITNNTGSTLLNCSRTSVSVTATGGVSYSWNNSLGSSAAASITAPGSYTVTATGTNGCTSTASVSITQNIATSTGDTTAFACNSFSWYGTTYNSSATPTHTFANVNGCDSVVTLHLTVGYANTGDTTVAACNNFTWYGTTYNSSATPTHTFTNASGCDSVVTAHIVINYSTSSSYNDIACNTLTLPWGQTVTTSGNYNHTYQTVNGCDSVVTAHIVINYSSTSSFNDTACNTLTLPWGQIVTTSGNYNHTYQTVNGCDSVVTAHIVINYSTTSSFNDTACNTLTLPWSQVVTTSGNYNQTYQTVNGCDSIVTAHIVINNSTSSSFNDTACNSLTLPWSQVVTTSGNYNHTYQTVNGCDSVVTAHIVINYSTSSSYNDIACNTLTLPWGQTVTTSGNYNHTYQTVNGCDSVVTAHIVINYSTTSSFNDTACNTLTLPWSQIVTTSGSYNHTYQTVNGCDSVVTAHIVINYSTSSQFNDTACNTLTLPWSQVVTTSGNYNHTYQTVSGCDSIVTAHIVINYSTSSSYNDTACNSLTLPWSQVVTTSGNYNHTYQTVNGCDSVVTAHIVINYSTTSSFNDTACNSLTLPWSQVVTTSGSYNHTYQTVNGCDSVVTANIVINYGTHNTTTQSACATYTWNGTAYTQSGTYTYAYTNASGCASVDTLRLTINALPTSAVAVDGTRCGTGTVVLSATVVSGITVDWYDAASGGTALSAGSTSFTTPSISSTTIYYAEARDIITGCVSAARTAVTATVGAIPTAGITNNTGSTILNCTTTAISVTATGGVSYSWNNSLGSSASASITSAGTYTVSVTGSNGCTATSSITITRDVTTPTAGITNNTGSTILTCSRTAISVTATGGTSYSWSNSLGSSASASITSPGTYTVTVTGANGCTSTASITVTQSNTLPAAPVVTNGSRCGTGTVTLSATSSTGTVVDWYESSSATTPLLSASNTYTTPSISTSTNYFVVARDTITGCLSTQSSQPSQVNNALRFDGTNDFISVFTNTGIPIGNSNYTIEAWIKPYVFTSSYSTNGIIGWGDWSRNYQVNAFRLESAGLDNYWMGCDVVSTSLSIFAAQEWRHVACSYDGTTRKLYVDGLIVTSDIPTCGHTIPYSSNLKIGTTVNTEYFNGALDEIRVWNLGRTQSQIQANMNATLTGNEPGLVAYYNFDQGVSEGNNTGISTLLDLTPNHNNGSLNNFSLTGTTSNFVSGPSAVVYSPRTVATATVNALPTVASSSNGSTICTSGTTNLTATASAGAKIDWYAASTGGTALATVTGSFTTPILTATTTYYAEARDTISGCISAARTALTATVGAAPTAGITNNTGSTILTCSRTAISVTATGGTSYSWSNSLGSSASASITSPGTYTVTVTGANGCTSTASITVTQSNTLPAAPVVTNGSRCGNGTVTLSATSGTGTVVDWYESTTATTPLLSASNTYTTPSISTSANYYVVARDTVTGCLSSQSVNNALRFDGSNDFISVFTNTGIPIGNSNYTIEAWIKPYVFTTTNTNGIIGWGDWGVPNKVNAFRLDRSGLLNYWWGPDLITLTSGTVSSIFTAQEWRHVACSFDGTTRKLYVDGLVVASDIPGGHTTTNSSNLKIGTTNNSEYFNGALDEIRVWNLGRTQTQIQANMSSTLTGNETGLVAYYNFDQGVSEGNNTGISTLLDLTPNHNNGSFNNFSLTGTTSNFVSGLSTFPGTVGNGSRTIATATVNPLPASAVGVDSSRYGTGTVSLSATVSSGITVDWYAAASGGAALSTGSTSFTTPSISSTTIYYAQARNTTTGCVSATRTAVTATVNALLVVGVSISSNATNNKICRGTAVTFTATPTNGGNTPTYQWKLNGTNIFTGSQITLNNIQNNDQISVVMTTSLSAANVTSTTATSNTITLTVNNLPSVVSTTPAFITSCATAGSATINAVPTTGSVIDWYASTSSTTPLLTSSNSYTTPNISSTTTYYPVARDTVTGCQSNGLTSQTMAISMGPNNAYIQTPKTVTGSFTIEFWFKPAGSSSAGCASWRCGEGLVDANTGDASDRDFGITIYNNYVAFGMGNGTGNPDVSILSTTNVSSRIWRHIAASWDSTTGSMKLYVNGNLEASAIGGTASRNGQSLMRLGSLLQAPGNGFYGYYSGSLDEVRVWRKVRTQADIQANYTTNLNGREDGLAQYYNFNQGIANNTYNGTQTTLYDITPNGNNGSLNQFASLANTGIQGTWWGTFDLSFDPAKYPVVVTKIPLPTVTSSTGSTICGSGATTLTVAASAGSKIDWYADASGGTALATGIGTYTTPTLSATTTYYAEARDTVTGCVSTSRTAVTATVGAIPTAGITNNTGSTILTCSSTAISVTATGGSSYSWSNSLGSSANASITAAGTYTVTVTGSNGCTATSSITITQNITTPTASITNNTGSTVVTCTTTSISVTATGGATYSWSNSLGSSANASITAAGTYTVTVTGSNGCTATSTITTTQNNTAPAAGITNNTGATILTCTRTSINVTATGVGSSYSWNNSLGSSASASITSPGTYTVTVTGANACTTTSSITVTQDITAPTAGITNNTGSTILNCTTTAISVTATGGSSYSWSNSLGSSASASITSPGTYTVTVTGANGCTSTSSITITRDVTVPTAGIINNTGSNILTCTRTSISVTATGVGSYSWSNSLGSSAAASITSPGTFTVTVTGTNGCTSTASITVTQSNTIPSAPVVTNGSRCGNGTVTLSATSGTGTVVDWYASAMSSSPFLTASNTCTTTSLSSSTNYYLISRDTVTGCTSAKPRVTNALNFDGINDIVNAGNGTSLQINRGTIEAWIKTGNAGSQYRAIVCKPYAFGLFLRNNVLVAYDWLNFREISTGINLADNSWHHVALSFDARPNVNTAKIYIDSILRAQAYFDISNQNDSMYIGENPSGVVQQFTGTIDEVRVWNVARTQSEIGAIMNSELSGRESGLVAYYNFNQGVAGGTNTNITSLTDLTSNSNNASINNFTLTGNASNFVDGPTLTPVTVVTANVQPLPTVTSSSNVSIICTSGTTNLNATASAGAKIDWYADASGGTTLATGTSNFTTPTLSATTTYYAEARDTLTGCVSSSRTAVTATFGAIPTAGITNNTGSTVLTCATTAISVIATGGSSYSWSNSLGTSANASITAAGTYTVTVTSANGCQATSSITVTRDVTTPTAGITNNTGSTVLTCATTAISVTATGGATYSWNNSLGSSANASITAPGTYTVTVTGANGCTATSSITVTRDVTTPTAGITNNTGSTILNCTTTAISVTATGGVSYSWNNSLGSSDIASITLPGTYTVTVTGANGCTSTSSITVTQDITTPTAGITNNTGSTLLTCSRTAISITATGGSSYSWSNSLGTSANASINAPGTYTVTATASNGCSSTANISITQNISTSAIDTTAFACNSFTWYGTTYTGSATPTKTFRKVNGCDSVITLHLTVGHSNTGDTTAVVCNSFTWFGTTYTSSANPTRTFINASGCDSVVTLHLTITSVANLNATTITGTKNVCAYIGTNTPVTYTASCIGATSYAWTLPPNTMLVSGQGTANISVKFLPGFAANANKQIRVVASSPCGASPIKVFYTLAQTPVTPATIIASTANVCPSIGTNIPIIFTIPRVAEAGNSSIMASSYLWTAQSGTTTITHLSNVSEYDTSIAVTFANNFTSSNITVQAINQCGLSPARSYFVSRNNPSTPSLISGPTNACEYSGATGLNAIYSVTASSNVDSYTWTLPAGVTNVAGQGTNTITFRYPTGFAGGSISVIATNGCGTSNSRSMVISRLVSATPGNIDVINPTGCPNRLYTYSISSLPGNATATEWSVPTGGTIVSGQGTISISVSYNTGVVDGLVTVRGINNCGASSYKTSIVKLAPCPAGPTAPMTKGLPIVVSDPMEVKVFPNPTINNFSLQVITADQQEVMVRILDVQGRFIKSVKVDPYQTISIGSELKSGSYMLEVRQGNSVKTTRVVKY